MATKYEHTRLSSVDSNGNVNVLYPLNTADDVHVNISNSSIPANTVTVQNVVDKLGDMAFNDGKNLAYLGTGTDYSDGEVVDSEIRDDEVSEVYAWSSSKTENEITSAKEYTDDKISNIKHGIEYKTHYGTFGGINYEDLNTAFDHPVSFSLNGDLANGVNGWSGKIIGANTSTKDALAQHSWYVEYVPFSIKSDGTVISAMQRWSRYLNDQNQDSYVMLGRFYYNGIWHEPKRLIAASGDYIVNDAT